MASCTIADGCLVHDAEIVSIFKHLSAAFLSLDAQYYIIAWSSLELILFDCVVAFQNAVGSLRSIERKQHIR